MSHKTTQTKIIGIKHYKSHNTRQVKLKFEQLLIFNPFNASYCKLLLFEIEAFSTILV